MNDPAQKLVIAAESVSDHNQQITKTITAWRIVASGAT